MAQVIDKQLTEYLDPVAAKYNLPVIITEFGTGNYDGTNTGHFNFNDVLDNNEQAEYYEAGLRAFAEWHAIRTSSIHSKSMLAPPTYQRNKYTTKYNQT